MKLFALTVLIFIAAAVVTFLLWTFVVEPVIEYLLRRTIGRKSTDENPEE